MKNAALPYRQNKLNKTSNRHNVFSLKFMTHGLLTSFTDDDGWSNRTRKCFTPQLVLLSSSRPAHSSVRSTRPSLGHNNQLQPVKHINTQRVFMERAANRIQICLPNEANMTFGKLNQNKLLGAKMGFPSYVLHQTAAGENELDGTKTRNSLSR